MIEGTTMQIWKTDITIGSGTTMLPKGAKPISVHLQNGTPVMWSIVDPSSDLEEIEIHVAGTGHDLPDNLGAFIGTFLIVDDSLVFHVFELT